MTSTANPVAVRHIDRVRSRIQEVLVSAAPSLDERCAILRSTQGKLLRPSLVLMTADLFPHDSECAIEVAATVELIHIASLVHDDVIDQAGSRRGLPTINALWGSHSAVITGDFLFAHAFSMLARCGLPGVLGTMAQAIMEMCEGEAEQLARAYDCGLSETEYLDCIGKKTASLLGACCEAGAAVGRAPREVRDCLTSFGRSLGIAFQIVDDILDFVGEDTGKPLCSDVRQGLLTLPVLRLNGDSSCRLLVEQAFGRQPVEEGVLTELRRFVVDSGVLSECRDLALQYAESAAVSLSPLRGTGGIETLASLAQAAVNRKL